MNRRYRQSAIVIALTLTVHGLLWWMLTSSPTQRSARPAQPRVTLLIVSQPIAPTVVETAATTKKPKNNQTRITRPDASTPTFTAPSINTTLDVAPVQAAATASSGPASAAPPSLLDTAATRRAIREAARQSSMAERAASQAGLEAAHPEQRLGNAIADTAKGDCLKGEFAGGGMGLLSLPFLAVAALRGDCAK